VTASLPSSSVLWERLFKLEDRPGVAIHIQLRRAIVAAILNGHLGAGAAMPSSRELAQVLAIGRNTVTSAYHELIDEGYLEARPRKGVFVAENCLPLSVSSSQHTAENSDQASSAAPRWQQRILRSLSDRSTLVKPKRWQDYPYRFVYGTYDAELFPTEGFRECCLRSLGRVQMPQWAPDLETDDVPELIEQIRDRLLPRRGVFARADEILITVGSQHAFYLLAEALFDQDTRLGLEEPGHPHARNSFAMRSPAITNLPVDHDGLVTSSLGALDYLYVTPSHQSPTTATMTLSRREQLLQRAHQLDFVVIEDDYEAEHLYAGTPMPALKSLDRGGRVIYIGSLSKSLSPALRLGYIVAPTELVKELRVLRHAMVRHPSAFLQHAYALFLSLGHHDAHARRVNAEMQLRIQRAAEALAKHLPGMRFRIPQGGASLWLESLDGLDSVKLAERAREFGVLIEAGDVFFANPPKPCSLLRLRLSSIKLEQIEPGIKALAEASAALLRESRISRAA
jgi:GntR family transcriptional regulator/MocR family aminotransferase